MTLWAIVPAAGLGKRFGSNTPKQYLTLLDRTVLEHSLSALLALPSIERVLVAINPADQVWSSLSCASDPRVEVISGGAERQESVRNALLRVMDCGAADDWVLVHDAVRPCVEAEDIERLIALAGADAVGGLLVAAMDNTVKQCAAGAESRVERTLDRAVLWNAMTPQMFRAGPLLHALEAARADGAALSDESSAMERCGHAPLLIESAKSNIKITHPSDLVVAQAILKSRASID